MSLGRLSLPDWRRPCEPPGVSVSGRQHTPLTRMLRRLKLFSSSVWCCQYLQKWQSHGKPMEMASYGTVVMLKCTSGEHEQQLLHRTSSQPCDNPALHPDGHPDFLLQKAESSLPVRSLIALERSLILGCQEFASSSLALA